MFSLIGPWYSIGSAIEILESMQNTGSPSGWSRRYGVYARGQCSG